MASLTFDDGITTTVCSTICALRMRVSMSAIGSVMLMLYPLGPLLPACLDDARHFAAHGEGPQLVAAEAELAEIAARAAGNRTSVAQTRRIGIARQLLHLEPGRHAILVGRLGVVHDRDQHRPLLGVFLHQRTALLVTVDQGKLRHFVLSS